MAHETQKHDGHGLTSEELKDLLHLLKHPKIKDLVDQVKSKEE